jgi:tryptophan halogenase
LARRAIGLSSMNLNSIRKIVIVGGGTAGWMAAAAIARKLRLQHVSVRLIESAEIGIVGVGEATVPHLRFFNESLGFDEAEFMRSTQATFKLGIEFCNWGRRGDAYIHPFGELGKRIGGIEFHHFWMKLKQQSEDSDILDLFNYSLPIVMAKRGKFAFPAPDIRSVASTFAYAYHFDATLYAPYLRKFAESQGVTRTEGKVVDVELRPEDGHVAAVKLENGERIEGDLFVDCSGFRGLLIEQALKTGYDDWSHWLPCDRAVAAPCETRGMSVAYTRAIAREAGWQWRIPLQRRVGNGYVYSSQYISDEDAEKTLRDNLEGPLLAEPRQLRFVTGRRKKTWNKNVVAVGLAGGFLEPLESTSIYLIQQAITYLLELFPERGFDAVDVDEFNRLIDLEFERVRDFLVLHYHATERDDAPLWNYVRTMSIPDSLTEKMELFKDRGYVVKYKVGMFLESSWHAVYLGQRILPTHFDPLVDGFKADEVRREIERIGQMINATADSMPTHEEFLRRHGAAVAVAAE